MIDGLVKSHQSASCHSERSEESNHIKPFQILHFVQDDKTGLLRVYQMIYSYIKPRHGCQ